MSALGLIVIRNGEFILTEKDDLIKLISNSIARLRQVIDEPVSIQWAEDVEIEVRPAFDDDRVLVGRKDWGSTIVNYTSEGVILDVVAEGDVSSVHTACVYADELMLQAPSSSDSN